MVQLRCLLVLIFLTKLSCNVSLEPSDLVSDLTDAESKHIVVRSKDETFAKNFAKNDFHCDLTLLPQQKKLMYFGARSDVSSASADVSYDLYRWPKNKEGFVVVPYTIPKSSKYCEFTIFVV